MPDKDLFDEAELTEGEAGSVYPGSGEAVPAQPKGSPSVSSAEGATVTGERPTAGGNRDGRAAPPGDKARPTLNAQRSQGSITPGPDDDALPSPSAGSRDSGAVDVMPAALTAAPENVIKTPWDVPAALKRITSIDHEWLLRRSKGKKK